MNLSGVSLLAVYGLYYTEGFILGHRKTNCLVSPWGKWSNPFGFGARSRKRVVLRYSENGGEPCPIKTEDVELTKQQPSIHTKSKTIATKFLRRKIKTSTNDGGLAVDDEEITPTEDTIRDLLVIIDSSGSIGMENFKIVKRQVGRLLELLCPYPDPFNINKGKNLHHKAAVITFSDSVEEIFDFNAKKNTDEVKEGINQIIYQGGRTCTGEAFEHAYNMFTKTKGMREDAEHEILILTDGQPNCDGDIEGALSRLTTKGVKVFGLMIGTKTDKGKDELLSYVSVPKPDHLFAVDNFQELEKLLNLIKRQINTDVPCAPLKIRNEN